MEMAIAALEAEEELGSDYRGRASLRVSGDRYVLLSQPSAGGDAASVVDLAHGIRTALIPAGSYSVDLLGGTILFVEEQRILYYKVDMPALAVLPGSELRYGETYASEEGAQLSPELTQGNYTITARVFSETEPLTTQSTGRTLKFKPLRDLHLILP